MQKINEYARVFAAVREEKVARVYLRLYNADLVLPSEIRIYRINPPSSKGRFGKHMQAGAYKDP